MHKAATLEREKERGFLPAPPRFFSALPKFSTIPLVPFQKNKCKLKIVFGNSNNDVIMRFW